MSDSKALLDVSSLRVAYGPVEAVQGIDFQVGRGQICCLVGANGAGKSSTLHALSGLIPLKTGRMLFEGEDLAGLKSHQIVQRGLVQVAEGRAILTTMTVRENLELGAYCRKDRVAISRDFDWVMTLFPRLKDRLAGMAGSLSGGEQQMLAIGRALLARPRLLLLDEPSMGLAPVIVQGIFRTLREINQNGVSMLLVEQNVRRALTLVGSGRGYVLESGLIVASGRGVDLLEDQRVLAAYTGG